MEMSKINPEVVKMTLEILKHVKSLKLHLVFFFLKENQKLSPTPHTLKNTGLED